MISYLSVMLLFIVSIASILFWTYLWQLKEYRLDRLFIHIRDTEQGKQIFFSFTTLVLLIGIGFSVLAVLSDVINSYFSLIVFACLAVLMLHTSYLVVYKKFKHPIFTAKAIGIFLLSLVILAFLTIFPLTDMSFWTLFLLICIPLIVAFVVFLFAFPTEIFTDMYMQKASFHRKKYKKLQVIAVSGSYGKSSTKEVIASVLSKKFHVVKTNLSNNTPLVIAKTILQKIDATTDFFIVELGAYKRGEIRQLAAMVGPTLSVTTAVSDQHIALYGGMEDIIASELELLDELPKSAYALCNANSEHMNQLVERAKHVQPIYYIASEKKQKSTVITASHIVQTPSGVTWKYTYNGQTIPFVSPLLGKHTVENILPAVFIGGLYGMDVSSIRNAVEHLTPLPKTMEKKKILPGVTIIDDSFNASPESVASAIDFLTLFPKRKFFIMSPLIELGKKSKQHHEDIGEHLADVDYLFLTNSNFLKDIKKGIEKKHGKTKVIVGQYRLLATKLQTMLKKGDAAIFEGKEAGIILNYL